MYSSTFSSSNLKSSLFSFFPPDDELNKKIPLCFSGEDISLSSKNATNPQWKENRLNLDWYSRLISVWESEMDLHFEFTTKLNRSPGWLMCCWDRGFAMCGEISQGLCDSRMLDIPIETVKNRWSLGMDTMKQNSETGTIALAVSGWQKL